jgi:uncharacterized membrane protein HdeD (DUF308 family)
MTPNPSMTRRRPRLVWAIVIFYGVDFVLVTLITLLIAVNWEKLPPSAKESFRTIPVTTWLIMAVVVLLWVLGTIQLFRLRRSAFYFYASGLVLGAVGRIVISQPLSGYTLLGWGTGLFVCAYAWHLSRRGVLA